MFSSDGYIVDYPVLSFSIWVRSCHRKFGPVSQNHTEVEICSPAFPFIRLL